MLAGKWFSGTSDVSNYHIPVLNTVQPACYVQTGPPVWNKVFHDVWLDGPVFNGPLLPGISLVNELSADSQRPLLARRNSNWTTNEDRQRIGKGKNCGASVKCLAALE